MIIQRTASNRLGCSLAFLLASGATAGEPPSERGPQTGMADQLCQSLLEQGWSATQQADGSVIYRPPAATDAEPQAPPQEGTAAQLRRELESQGWLARQGEDGSLLFRPPSPKQEGPGDTSVSPQPSLATRLQQSLEAQGWHAVMDTTGGTIYLPPEAVMQPAAALPEPQPAAAAGLADQIRELWAQRGWPQVSAGDDTLYYLGPQTDPQPEPDPEAAPAAAPETLAGQLETSLRQQGWVSEPAADGGVIYRRLEPRGAEPEADALPEGEAAADLREALENRGWRTDTTEDGSLILILPAAAP